MLDDTQPASSWQRRVEQGFERWGRFVIRHRVAAVALSFVATAALLSQLPKLTIDNSPEAMLLDDDPAVVAYDAFREQFGREDRIVVLIDTPDPFAPAFLEKLRRLHRAIESELPYVEAVDSLINARVVEGNEDGLVVGELLEDWPKSPAEFERVRARALSNPLHRDTLLCADGRCTALAITPWTYSRATGTEDAIAGFDEPVAGGAKPVHLTSSEGDELIRRLLALLGDHATPEFRPHVAGELAMVYRINTGMAQDLAVFLPATLAAVAALLALIFRRAVAVVLPLMIVVLSLASTLGLMIVLGIPGSTAVQILPVFLLTVGVCDAVHILAIAYQRRQEGDSQPDAIAFAIRHTGLAVFMTSVTTAAGMASFLTAEMGAVRDLGLIAPIGVGLAYLYTMVTLPALLAIVPMRVRAHVPSDPADRPIDRFLIAAGRFATRKPGHVLVPTALLALIAVTGLLRVGFSHNALNWFPPEDWARRDFAEIDRRLGGSVSLDLVFDAGEAGGLYEPARLRAIETFVEEVRESAVEPIRVGSSISLLDIVKETHSALHEGRPEARRIPETREAVAQELLLFESSGSDDTLEFVDAEYRRTRVNLRLPFVDALAFPPFLRELDARAATSLGGGLAFERTGVMTLLSQVFEAVIRSMARSYVAALILITPLMMLLLGSFRRGLVAMVPNVLPILAVLGVMGFLGITLDSTTMMIGAMIIGIAVDDTIHFMHKFHRSFDETADLEFSVCETLRTTGSAMLFTSVALTLGFLVFAASDMRNIRIFGLFSALATAVAFAADLWVAPALLAAIERTRRRRRGPAGPAVLRTPARGDG
ncbi:MAG: MMPL family transporter [Deltaproteobacteria bacterium]|nr:MMPL family transporter [Deltaproteobacteria bacterium]